ncbi:hypothetical protein [Amycolatopsis sp. NPDC051128]|uniref:hypothetical protein n=1 Tax=Amycolatopsis sp. NPDC051128 TaxID=3155412 RepID=UPI0034472C3A
MCSQRHPLAPRLLALFAALLAVASLVVGLAPAPAAAAPACDRGALVAGRLAELGRFGVEWRVGRTLAAAGR